MKKGVIPAIAVAGALVATIAMAPFVLNDEAPSGTTDGTIGGQAPSAPDKPTSDLVTTSEASANYEQVLSQYLPGYNGQTKTISDGRWAVDVPDTNYTYVAEFLHNGERENAPDKALLFYPNDEAPIVINYFYAIETHTRDVDFMAWSRNNADLVDEYEDAYIKVDWLDVYFADEPGISITGYEQIDFSNGKVNGYILYSPKTNRRFVYVVSGGTEQCVMTFRRSEVVEEDVIDEKELNKVYEALVFAVVSTLRTA